MRTKHLIPGLAVALALTPVAADAQKPKPKPPAAPAPATPVTPPTTAAITLNAKPTRIVYSRVTTLSGRLSGRKVGGVSVRLEQDTTRPYGDAYKPSNVTAATTAANGTYSLAAKPRKNTQYRVVANVSPAVTSLPKLVLVRIRVGIRLSDSTPRRGSRVRFSGSVLPAHDGRVARIQRRSPSGRFVTVARTRLRDAGNARSTYSRRVRVSRDGVYRVKVSGDGDHINGFSRRRTIDVHG